MRGFLIALAIFVLIGHCHSSSCVCDDDRTNCWKIDYPGGSNYNNAAFVSTQMSFGAGYRYFGNVVTNLTSIRMFSFYLIAEDTKESIYNNEVTAFVALWDAKNRRVSDFIWSNKTLLGKSSNGFGPPYVKVHGSDYNRITFDLDKKIDLVPTLRYILGFYSRSHKSDPYIHAYTFAYVQDKSRRAIFSAFNNNFPPISNIDPYSDGNEGIFVTEIVASLVTVTSASSVPLAGGWTNITGTSFGTSATVTIAGKPCTSVKIFSDRLMGCQAAAGTGANVPIEVTTSGETVIHDIFTYYNEIDYNYCNTDHCNVINECMIPSICPTGYTCAKTYVSYQCIDVNECDGPNMCDENAICTNTLGGYTCTCKDGFNGDGKNCGDINECWGGVCGWMNECTNTIGGFICNCTNGFAPDGITCVYPLSARDWNGRVPYGHLTDSVAKATQARKETYEEEDEDRGYEERGDEERVDEEREDEVRG